MNNRSFSICLTMLMGLAACGGGGNGENTSTPGAGTAYAFVPPVVNSSRVYSETIIDNSNNTIVIGYSQSVTAVTADGVITEQLQSTTGAGDAVDGTVYTVPTETETYNAGGRETGYTYTESNGNPGSCTYDPYAGGPMPPLSVGQSWQINYAEVCNGNAPINYSQTGNVLDVESVTVPDGTFTALKLQSTTTWTNADGTSNQQSTIDWLDVATFHSVKQSITHVESGTPSVNGYAISRQIVLQSAS